MFQRFMLLKSDIGVEFKANSTNEEQREGDQLLDLLYFQGFEIQKNKKEIMIKIV